MDLRVNVRRIPIASRQFMTYGLSSSITTRASSLLPPLTVIGSPTLTTSQQSCRTRLTCCSMNVWGIPEYTVLRSKTGSPGNKALQEGVTVRTQTHWFEGYGRG